MDYSSEFKTIEYVIKKSEKVLFFAHNHPDSDTVGANLAMHYYIKSLGKKTDVACFDEFPEYLKQIADLKFIHPNKLDLKKYDAIFAIDSVERGFEKIKNKLIEKQVLVLIDHHPDINLKADVEIIDASYSSASEIVFNFFEFFKIKITNKTATLLLMGILGDTGNLQHSNTSPRVMRVVAELLNRGASVSKIAKTIFVNNDFATLKLWGKALERAKINKKNKMISTVIFREDLSEHQAGYDAIADVASILNTVPDTSFSLVLSERENGIIKGSLRSEKHKGVDVSQVAHQFGGGGHKLASGFEVKGKIKKTKNGWKII